MIGPRTALAAVILVVLFSAAPTAHAAINFVADLGANEVTTNSLSITTTATAPAGSSIIMLRRRARAPSRSPARRSPPALPATSRST